MKRSFVFFTLLLGTLFASPALKADAKHDDPKNEIEEFDLCIIGAGPSGLSAAAFAKDRGASVLVIEKQAVFGGNSNTEFFIPPAPGLPNWIDIGTTAFPDTKKLNEIFGETWTIDSAAIANRFAAFGIFYLDLTNPANATPTYGANFLTGQNYGQFLPSPEQQGEIAAALQRLLGIFAKYPFIEQSQWPSPMPAELLEPFSNIIQSYQLEPLIYPLFVQILNGGAVFNYSTELALYSLARLKPALIYILTVPNIGFSVVEGSIQMYNGMVNYVGSENVLLNSQVINAIRTDDKPIVLDIKTQNGQTTTYKTVECKNLLVAFPETLKSIQFLNPDGEEKKAFEDFYYTYDYTFEVNVNGPIADSGQGFTLLNVDMSTPFDLQSPPNLAYIQRGLPFGPAQTPLLSSIALSDAQVRQIFQQQVQNISTDLLTNVSIVTYNAHDQYYPQLTKKNLASQKNAYKRIANLQGHRNTYWTGAGISTAGTVDVWQQSYNIIQMIQF